MYERESRKTGALTHSFIHLFIHFYAVMGNELDKIEQNGSQIAKHPKISEEAGQQLIEEVKVSLLVGWGFLFDPKSLSCMPCSLKSVEHTCIP